MFSKLMMAAVASAALTATAAVDTKPQPGDAPAVHSLFVPTGFDDNDKVQVVLEGVLPDPCHELDKALVEKDTATGKITITAKSRRMPGECPDIAVPFIQEVRLGELDKGTFTVQTSNGLSEKLVIDGAKSPQRDNYYYAPIDNTWIEYPEGPAPGWLAVLEGRFTNTCLTIVDVRVTHTGRTIQMLPILKLKDEKDAGMTCKPTDVPFRKIVKVPTLAEEGRYLLHVRTQDGAAKNIVFSRTPGATQP